MLKKLVCGKKGQGLIEYMLIISLVAIVVIVALTFFGWNVKNQYNETINGVASPLD